MVTSLFLGFVALMAAVVIALSTRYLRSRTALVISAGLALWLGYVGLLGYLGVFGNTALRPPGIAFLFVPVLVFLGVYIRGLRTPGGTQFALAFPLWVLPGVQCFRVVVELFLHRLWIDGLIPRMLTFSGANLDIYVGASAPLIAWLSTRGSLGRKLAVFWNVLGLLVITNVVIRAVLTAPGPLNLIHAEVPNRLIGMFPFSFIPGFFVPLAVVLHGLSLRATLAVGSKPAADSVQEASHTR